MTKDEAGQRIVIVVDEAQRDRAATGLGCLICDTPLPGAVCGRKAPCPTCGFLYPLGDCSDLAEN